MTDITQIAAGAALLAGLFLIVVVAPKLWWLLFGVLIWVSSFSGGEARIATTEGGVFTEVSIPFAFPLNILSDYGRPICGVILVALVAQGIVSRRGWRQRRVVGAAIFLFTLEMYYAVRMLVGGGESRAVFALITFALMSFYFSIVLPNRLQTLDDFKKPIYAIAFAAVLFALGILYQTVIDTRPMYPHRFQGTTLNPNHCGHMLGVLVAPVLWLGLNGDLRKGIRVALFCLLGLFGVWLLRTGSRGATLMMIVGVMFVLRTRMKHVFIGGTLTAAVYFLVTQFNSDADINFSRLTSALDTRTAGWQTALAGWGNSPFWGYAEGNPNFTENSYIAAAAGFGVVGAALMGAFVFSCFRNLWRLDRDLRQFPQLRSTGDLVIGGVLGILTSGMFECLLLGIYTPWVYSLFSYLALLAFLQDYLAHRQSLAAPDRPDPNQRGLNSWSAARPAEPQPMPWPAVGQATGPAVGHATGPVP